jgi:hypothetical protein
MVFGTMIYQVCEKKTTIRRLMVKENHNVQPKNKKSTVVNWELKIGNVNC